MQSLTRRLFLGRTAAAVPAAVLTTVPALNANTEDPRLLALGEQIDPLLTAYRRASARYAEARTEAERNCSPVPEEIVMRGPEWRGCTEREVDVEGKDVWPDPYVDAIGKTIAMPPRNLFNSHQAKLAQTRHSVC
jgi:hypothetical protein